MRLYVQVELWIEYANKPIHSNQCRCVGLYLKSDGSMSEWTPKSDSLVPKNLMFVSSRCNNVKIFVTFIYKYHDVRNY